MSTSTAARPAPVEDFYKSRTVSLVIGYGAGTFDATMKDPDFIAETNKVKLEVSPTSGAEIDRLLEVVCSTPKDVIEKAKQAITN